MDKETKQQIESYLEQWDQDNTPETFEPIRDDDFLYVFGGCTGVVVYPQGDRLPFTLLSEDDGHWFVVKDPTWDNFWMSDLQKVLKIAEEYMNKYASIKFFSGTSVPCGYKMPWKLGS